MTQATATAKYPTALLAATDVGYWANLETNVLATTITSSSTSIVMSSATTGMPTTGEITIDSERILYTSKDDSTKTLTIPTSPSGRGWDGSTAAAHTAGATVRMNAIALHYNQLLVDLIAVQTKVGAGTLTAGSVIFSDGTKLAQDNANLFWDDTNNRLGVGTSAPGTLLHIKGSTAVHRIETTSGGGKVFDLRVGVATTGAFDIYDASAVVSRFVVDTNGRVFINTNGGYSEATTLVVGAQSGAGSVTEGLRIKHLSAPQNGNGTGIIIQDGSQNLGSIWAVSTAADSSTSNLNFRASSTGFGTAGLTLTSTGTLSIKTNAAWLTWRNAANDADLNVLRVDSGNNTVLNTASGTLLGLQANGSTWIEIGSTIKLLAGGGAATTYVINSGADTHVWNTTSAEIMRLSSTGLTVGGLATPDSKAHVYSGSAGTVTAVAGTILTAENSGNGSISILTPAANTGSIYFGSPTSNVRGEITYNHAADSLSLVTAGATALLVTSAGLLDYKAGSTALGGGSAATLGTIGGSGPTAAGQSKWLKIKIAGTDHWIPAWV